MSARLRWPSCGLLAAALIALTGCDRMPWSPRSDDNAVAATTGTTTKHAAVTPNRPPVAPEDLVATVNDVPVSKVDVELRVQELKTLVSNLGREWKPLTAEQLEAVLDELINNEAMSQDAVALGLDRATQTQRRWELVRRTFFAQEWLVSKRDQLQVSDADVTAYYEQNKRGFREPERRQLRQLIVASEDEAKRALARLLQDSADFASLAQQISTATTAPNGGLISEWVLRAGEKTVFYRTDADAAAAGVISLDPSLEAAAFAIDREGGLSNYVKGPDNRYHIFQLAKLQVEREQPISEVWDGIKNFLLAQKLQGALNQLKEKANVQRYPERLQGVTQ